MTLATGNNRRRARALRGAVGRRRFRRAVTLIELLLVLSVLAGLTAIAWPAVTRAFDKTRLLKAAEGVQADFAFARVQAMSTGLPYAFRIDAAANQSAVQAFEDETSAVEASVPADGSAATKLTGRLRTLPEGIAFIDVQRASDVRGTLAEQSLATAGGLAADTPPILFFPDGTSSEAVVTLVNQRGQAISITLRGVTGTARVGEVFPAQAGQGGAP